MKAETSTGLLRVDPLMLQVRIRRSDCGLGFTLGGAARSAPSLMQWGEGVIHEGGWMARAFLLATSVLGRVLPAPT